MQRQLAAATLAAALWACPSAGRAASCTVTASPLSFGAYDTLQAGATDSAAVLQVTCIPGLANPLNTPYTITLAGTGSGGDSVRSISSGSSRLYYQLYRDVARTLVWGNGSSSGAGVAGATVSTAVLTPGLQNHTVYARMPANQNVAPGLYLGNLLVTVEY